MTEELEVKNLEVTIQQLRNEAKEAADFLSSVNVLVEEAATTLLNKQGEVAEEELKLETIKRACQDEKERLSSRETEHETVLLDLRKNTKTAKDQEKLAIKDLSRVNEWIIKAEDVKRAKIQELSNLDAEISNKNIIVSRIVEVKNELETLEKQREAARQRNSDLLEKEELELLSVKEEIKDEKERLESVKNEEVASQKRKQLLDDEWWDKKKDLDILYTRMFRTWEKSNPGKPFPLKNA